MAPAVKKAMDAVGSALGSAHDWSADKLLRFVGGLFMEDKGLEDGKMVASLGRVAFWVVFGHVMYVFQTGGTLAAEELNVFYALLGYQGVKIGKDMVTEGVGAWKGQPGDGA